MLSQKVKRVDVTKETEVKIETISSFLLHKILLYKLKMAFRLITSQLGTLKRTHCLEMLSCLS